MSKAEEPAFPGQVDNIGGGMLRVLSNGGLTKRELFAATSDIPWNAVIETLELRGTMAPTVSEVLSLRVLLRVAEADALLAELEKEK